MADMNHPDPERNDGLDPGAVPIEGDEPAAPAHPRRAASAEFIVRSDAPLSIVLREAMDPANQSLGEALRLSYRVLQGVIAILLVLFLISGFRSVEDSQTGVMTLFGKIQGGEESELTPGLRMSVWPYPAAEFIVFEQRGAVSVNDAFWPNRQIGQDRSFEVAAPNIQFHLPMVPGLGPGRDGFVLLEDGIGHLQLQASYVIDSPVDFVNHVRSPEEAQRLVRFALQRGVVHATAKWKLDDILDQGEAIAFEINQRAQELLDELGCGVSLDRVQVTNLRPPLAIHTVMGELGQTSAAAQTGLAEARTAAATLLTKAAGQNHQQLLDLIEKYERVVLEAAETGVANPEAESLLNAIDAMLDSDQIGGDVAVHISQAKSYSEEISARIGGHAKRFAALLPQYQANPAFVIRRQWMDAYRRVLGRQGIETFRVPEQILSVNVAFKSDQEVMMVRRKADQERRKAEAEAAAGISGPYDPRFMEREMTRRLMLDEGGGVKGRLEGRNNP